MASVGDVGDPENIRLEITCDLEEVPGRGWVASAPRIRATAQGQTEDEAMRNLVKLVETYPDLLNDLLDEVRKAPARYMELVHA